MSAASESRRVVALVPTFRSATFLETTLATLAAQTHRELEVVVSDDASPDDTAARCECFAATDSRFRLIRQPVNRGWVGNVNALLAEAHGDYTAFAFQDDLLEPTYFERCIAALEADPSAILAYSDIALVHASGMHEQKRYTALEGVTDRIERARRVARQEGSWWIPNRGVFRMHAARAIGGLRRHAAGEFSADWPWLLHMSLLGGFVRVPEQLVTKIYRQDSLSRSWRFGARQWTAVTASAMREVHRAPIAASERLAVDLALAGFTAGRIGHSALRSTGRVMRALGLRGAPSDTSDERA